MSQDEWQALLTEHNSFSTSHGDAISAGEALEPSSTAKTIRSDHGKRVISDGPYAETKEQLGGFYVIEATDRDAAIAMVQALPLGPHGAIEIRPVMEM